MPDQAHELRQMTIRHLPASAAGGATIVAVTGGKGGVGTTTVGWNLAAMAARAGRRSIFIDADPRGGDAAELSRLNPRNTLADVWADRRTWSDAAQTIRCNFSFLAGQASWAERDCVSSRIAARLLARLRAEIADADMVVVDVGKASSDFSEYFCLESDVAVMVADAEPASVVKTFAAIKTGSPTIRWCVAVNRAANVEAACLVHARLAWCARRMLGISLPPAGIWATAGKTSKKKPGEPIRLNLRTTISDRVRSVSVSDLLASWRNSVEFNEKGQLVRKIA